MTRHHETVPSAAPLTAWCPTCRTREEVVDEFDTDSGDRYTPARETYWVTALACGHTASDVTGRTTQEGRPEA